jgi:DNA-binding MarR family transcriptional regulator
MSEVKPDEFPIKVQRQIYQLVKLYQFCDRVCLAEHGVGASQGYTLLSLPPQGSMTMNDLSSAMGLANSTTTRIVDELVRKGLACRKSDKADRRVVKVELTVQGQELWRTLDKELQSFFGKALKEISEDERPSIIHSLERVTQLIAKALEGSGAC